ncbi:PaaI family thioesterase [Eisenibacter elegans]|jgi:uncharacterized protein (TIGR00369 family)|uniref:PaaI family thioesterase n=1 Tax=Eisenibacter elegans TaxID=997 RepID=UPI0003F9D2A4|nr:PaaI family thioesterase [Eisenibacter elegans]
MQEANPTTDFNADFYKEIFHEYIPFNKFLGFRLSHVAPEYSEVLIPFREEFIGDPRLGRLHGGVLMVAMDSGQGVAAMTTIDMLRDKIATLDLRIDYLAPAGREEVVVASKVHKSGSRVVFVSSVAYHPSAPEVILAEGRGVFSVKRR